MTEGERMKQEAAEFWIQWQIEEGRSHHTIDDWPVQFAAAFAAHILEQARGAEDWISVKERLPDRGEIVLFSQYAQNSPERPSSPSATQERWMLPNKERYGTPHNFLHKRTIACHAPPRCKIQGVDLAQEVERLTQENAILKARLDPRRWVCKSCGLSDCNATKPRETVCPDCKTPEPWITYEEAALAALGAQGTGEKP